MTLTITTADAVLKDLYPPDVFRDLTYQDRPLLGIWPKDESFVGRKMILPFRYSNPQGVSATFATAQSVTTSAKFEAFELTRVNEYSVANITGEALDAMSEDKGAFIDGMEAQIDAAINSLADRLESFIPRSGTGSLGKIAAGGISTYYVTLDTLSDIHNFEVGMTLVASATDGGSLRSGSQAVTAVNRRTGVLTAADSSWSGITSLTAADYLFASGDAANGGSNVATAGLAAWVPSSTPAATAFFGVDRTVDSRLYGVSVTTAGSLVNTAIIDAQSIAAENGGKPDTALLQNTKYRQLCKEIESKTTYTKVAARGDMGEPFANVSYSGVQVMGDQGPIDVLAARRIPSSYGYVLQLNTWKLCSIGPLTKWIDLDGNSILRQSSADGYEARMVSRHNLGCMFPGANAVISFT